MMNYLLCTTIMYIYIYIYIHNHKHIYIYIYTYIYNIRTEAAQLFSRMLAAGAQMDLACYQLLFERLADDDTTIQDWAVTFIPMPMPKTVLQNQLV